MEPNPNPGPYPSNRSDGRYTETAAQFQQWLKSEEPALSFRSGMDTEAFLRWKESVVLRLKDLLRFPGAPEAGSAFRVSREPRDGYALEKWELHWGDSATVPYLVLVPDTKASNLPHPAVLCFPGSGRTKENLAGEPELGDRPTGNDWKWRDNRMGYLLAKAGFMAVVVDNPAFGESASPLLERNALSLSLIWKGWSYEGLAAFQAASLLQALLRDERVDPKRIAASGHSLGAKYADFLGLLYPEHISAVVHNDFILDWRERMIALNGAPAPEYQVFPGFFQWFDYSDLQAALAPLPLLCSEGGRTEYLEKIRSAYRLLGAQEQMVIHHYEKFDSPQERKLDGVPIPEGISMETYFEYANVDVANHVYRADRAIPFLKTHLGLDASNPA
jgi:pimeloyl-ACP methyl ester carboxylesterase